MKSLQKAGISDSAIRCLVCQGLLEDVAEKNRPRTSSRARCNHNGPSLPATSRFVLTDKGVAFCREMADFKNIVPAPGKLPHFGPVPGSDKSCRQAAVQRRRGEGVFSAGQEPGVDSHLIPGIGLAVAHRRSAAPRRRPRCPRPAAQRGQTAESATRPRSVFQIGRPGPGSFLVPIP